MLDTLAIEEQDANDGRHLDEESDHVTPHAEAIGRTLTWFRDDPTPS